MLESAIVFAPIVKVTALLSENLEIAMQLFSELETQLEIQRWRYW